MITDKDGTEIAAGTGLKVAKWNDAFVMDGKDADGNEKVAVRGPTTGSNHDFIDRDDDRFNVWIYDPTKWDELGNATADKQRVEVKITTANAQGFAEYNDGATLVDAVRYTGTAKAAGWFWSDSQMLVSNEVDDKYNTEDPPPTAHYLQVDEAGPGALGLEKNGYNNGKQWKISDRTHRIALGGTVKAEYLYGAKDEASVLVRKNVKVHINILRLTAGGDPAITSTGATAEVHRANEQYAQVGIRLIPTAPNVVDPPTDPAPGVDLGNGLWGTNEEIDGKLVLTDEEMSLLGDTGPVKIRSQANDDIELYFINMLGNSTERRGWSYGAGQVCRTSNPLARHSFGRTPAHPTAG